MIKSGGLNLAVAKSGTGPVERHYSVLILASVRPGAAAEERTSQSELDGMRASVTAVRVRGDKLLFVYKLERLPTDRSWYLKQDEPLSIQYWDQDKKPLKSAHAFITVGQDFRYLKTTVATDSVEAKLPSGAVWFNVALGNSGLETKVARVPKPVQ